MKKFLLITASLLLTGCATTAPVVVPPLAPSVKTVNIPVELLIKCPTVPMLEDRAYTEGELVTVTKNTINLMESCRAKDSVLVDTINTAFIKK